MRWKNLNSTLNIKKGILNNNADALSRLEIEINSNSSSDSMTQHSADTYDSDFIPSTERPLNEFRNQIVLEISNETSRETETIFRNFHRITLKRPLFSPTISPKCINGLYCDEKTLANLQIIYKNYFSRGKSLKIFWTQTVLTDITDEIEQDQIVSVQHDANHRGINETTKHIAQTYFFPGIKSKVTKYINLCKLCLKSKYERHPYKQKFKFTETPSKPLEIVHTDIFIIKEKHYLTFCDKFSRLAMAIPIRTRNTIHVLKALTKFIATLGKPSLLVMDQEAAFTSATLRTFLEENTIEYHFTSVGQSSSNGTIEIVHRTLRELHNILSNKISTKDLPETTKINLAMAIYNDSIHSQIDMTPRELFFGFRNNVTVPEDLDERIKQKEKLYREMTDRMLQKKTQTFGKTKQNSGRV